MASFNDIELQSTSASHVKRTYKGNFHSRPHSYADNHGGSGLKILDFHESFLEEMENYRKKSDQEKQRYPHQVSFAHVATLKNAKSTIPSHLSSRKPTTNYPSHKLRNNHNLRSGGPSAHRESGSKVHQHSDFLLQRSRDTRMPYAHTNLPYASMYERGSKSIRNNDLLLSATKIIVNQFHAKSLVGSGQNEEKAKTQTQNDLTSSHHASNSASSKLPKNYFAKTSNRAHGFNSKQNANRVPDDDPCNAVDDVDHYSDSDSEEDRYVGHPFYIDGEQADTQQSHALRSSLSEDSDEQCEKYFTPKCVVSPSLFPNVAPYLNFASHSKKGATMPVALHKVLSWKLSRATPTIVRHVVHNSGFRINKNVTDWMGTWENQIRSPRYRSIRSHQKFNHMPGTYRISRKDSIWRIIHKQMRKFGLKEFGFMQKTYIMPEDIANLRQVWPKNAARLTKWIVKPPASARGTGIHVVNTWGQFSKDRPLIVQKYIEHPFLINDNKFDMRLYVVLTSIDPLRIYMYKDGLVRFASVKYSAEMKNIDNRCMHLTNYSINKNSECYSKNEDFNSCQGHKWTLQSLWSCLEERGVDTKRLWATLRNLVIKSIISGEYVMHCVYRHNVNCTYNCYELFGFDVLLDKNMVPWLLEINVSPSLHSDLPVDKHVKGPLIQSLLNIALYQVPPKLDEQQQADIIRELNVDCTKLCMDTRLFSTRLTSEATRKHEIFTNRSKDFRKHYLTTILEELLPDDVRCLIIAEDELNRCANLERIFPTAETYEYLKFMHKPRYYNRLLDAWENRYGTRREDGIAMLRPLCQEGYHLQGSNDPMDQEPNTADSKDDLLNNQEIDQPDPIAPNDTNTTAAPVPIQN